MYYDICVRYLQEYHVSNMVLVLLTEIKIILDTEYIIK